MRSLIFNFLVASFAVLVSSASVLAADLEPPRGKPILTISGAIKVTNIGAEAVFDRDMLEAQGTETVITKTPWFDGVSEFSGVRLDRLMELVGAQGQAVTATALNDYVTTIPIEDFSRYRVILALKRDGKYMSVREKGPLFIIYPFDSDPALRTQVYFGRAAWQVAKLAVE
ncbi:molybdopterin-dependent oxidoreductase [Pseudorhizobium endolithicum]|uniref:molybdopterin-dependent oxidoreductase n=1 Tax=Pseudorhizobium endolithicum TaxID=1191678 RepID=UPI00115AF5F2|nr:molybdopterin-dependent oxidoreductase [Pseudorhizobium endolithicum]